MTALLYMYIIIVYINCIWKSVPDWLKTLKNNTQYLNQWFFLQHRSRTNAVRIVWAHLLPGHNPKKINNLNLTISQQKPVLTYEMTLSNKKKNNNTYTHILKPWMGIFHDVNRKLLRFIDKRRIPQRKKIRWKTHLNRP